MIALVDHPLVTVYHGDCRELPQLDIVADLLVTDPPYGVQWQSGWRRGRDGFDILAGDESTDIAREGLRLAVEKLRNHRHVYVFGRYDLSDLPLTKPVELIWDKGIHGLGNHTLPWAPQHEPIIFATVCRSKANRAKGSGNLTARLRRGSVLRYQRLNSRQVSRHPTEKPVPLMRELIEASSCPGELVLDPFAGVGSTLVAALLSGRRAVGIEIDATYARIAAERVRAALLLLDQLASL